MKFQNNSKDTKEMLKCIRFVSFGLYSGLMKLRDTSERTEKTLMGEQFIGGKKMRNLKKTINAAICFVLTLAMILPANVKANAAEATVPQSRDYTVEEYNAIKDTLDALTDYDVTVVFHDAETEYVCDFADEHVHTDACYALICENDEHAHDENCYGLTCDKEEHEHGEDCIGLICDKEIHVHSNDCYAYEYAGVRIDNFWDFIDYLISLLGIWEYKKVNYNKQLVCGLEEHAAHTDDCYGITCTKELHTHDENCNGVICGIDEHEHDDSCYELNCDYDYEHTHTEDCINVIPAYYTVTVTPKVVEEEENNNENENQNQNENQNENQNQNNNENEKPVVEPVDNNDDTQETTPDVVEDGSDDKEQPVVDDKPAAEEPAESSKNDEQPATDAPVADDTTIIPAAPINNVPIIILPAWTAENTDDAVAEEAAPAAEEIVDVDTTPATPEGAVEEDVEAEVSEPTVVDDTEEEVDVDTTPATPQGAVEEEPEAEEETEDLGLDIVATPQGDVLPQTGVLSAVVFYGLGAICIAIGGATLVKVRRKEQD